MSSLSATPDMQSLQSCIPSIAGATPEIEGWYGNSTIIRTIVENTASEDNITRCGSTEMLLCSWTEPETKTRAAENEPLVSRTQAEMHPKETDSRLAQLGLVIALLGVISVVV